MPRRATWESTGRLGGGGSLEPGTGDFAAVSAGGTGEAGRAGRPLAGLSHFMGSGQTGCRSLPGTRPWVTQAGRRWPKGENPIEEVLGLCLLDWFLRI